MQIKNITEEEIRKALNKTNIEFDNNITFKYGMETLNKKGTRHQFGLTIKSSSNKGHRLGFMLKKDGNRYKVAAACWHVFGNFFDNILEIQPKAIIRVPPNHKIYKEGGTVMGNWKDVERQKANPWNNYQSVMYSELCEC